MSLHVYYLVGGEIPGNCGVSGWLIWLFFLRVQTPFAPSVLSPSLPLETLCLVQRVAAIAHSCQQALLGFFHRIFTLSECGMDPKLGKSKDDFSSVSAPYFVSICPVTPSEILFDFFLHRHEFLVINIFNFLD